MKILVEQGAVRRLMDSASGLAFSDLSTSVDGLLWISVYKASIKASGLFSVDGRWINHLSYPQLIHIDARSLKGCKKGSQKKKLDRLSTYTRSLLKLLIYKIV